MTDSDRNGKSLPLFLEHLRTTHFLYNTTRGHLTFFEDRRYFRQGDKHHPRT